MNELSFQILVEGQQAHCHAGKDTTIEMGHAIPRSTMERAG